MKPLLNDLKPDAIAAIRTQMDNLRREISLAKQRRAGLDTAIDSREKSLARLQAQLVLTGSDRQAATPA